MGAVYSSGIGWPKSLLPISLPILLAFWCVCGVLDSAIVLCCAPVPAVSPNNNYLEYSLHQRLFVPMCVCAWGVPPYLGKKFQKSLSKKHIDGYLVPRNMRNPVDWSCNNVHAYPAKRCIHEYLPSRVAWQRIVDNLSRVANDFDRLHTLHCNDNEPTNTYVHDIDLRHVILSGIRKHFLVGLALV